MPNNIAPRTRERARRLRREITPVEGILWSKIKALRRSHELHFRRQAPVGPLVVDFACLSRRVVVEVDGASHDGSRAAALDAWRDAFLHGEGFRVLRVSNVDVMRDVESLIETIIREAFLYETTSTPCPSPQGGGERRREASIPPSGSDQTP